MSAFRLEQVSDDELNELDSVAAEKWAGGARDLMEIIADTLKRQGVDSDRATTLAMRSTLEISQYLGGTPLYLPRSKALLAFLRRARIWREFTGANQEELALKYDLTLRTIQTALAEQRQIESRRRQKGLFGD